MVTGGGTLGEGVKLWDVRNLAHPINQFNWSSAKNGDIINPVINCVKFVPKRDLILVGASDNYVSAKCFDTITGECREAFNRVRGTCFSLDVYPDASLCAFGDGEGAIHFENLCYSVARR